MTNALAYYITAIITAVKSFIIEAPSVKFIKKTSFASSLMTKQEYARVFVPLSQVVGKHGEEPTHTALQLGLPRKYYTILYIAPGASVIKLLISVIYEFS